LFLLKLEQMDLEAREMNGNEKQKYSHRVKTYKNEMVKFTQDLVNTMYIELHLFIDQVRGPYGKIFGSR